MPPFGKGLVADALNRVKTLLKYKCWCSVVDVDL